ncbi:hypothetical protein GCM10022252_04060 [Streptosporangium oxazolinicum]|uniref:Uncharacterized protein n=1 Tax=Streptosporangium oxazolinicum TaxID=909287 RepID=A0ABP8AAR7_9ACTN
MLLLASFGVIILAIGLMGDSIGLWENSPFLTNLLSSLTGFCFAVPVAIIVLHRVSIFQMDHQQWRTLSGLASDLSHRMSVVAVGLRVHSSPSDHGAASDAFWAAHNETIMAIKNWLDALNRTDQQQLASALEQVITQGDRCVRAWNACWGSPLDVRGALAEIRMRWNTLIGDVEPRLRDIGRPLFSTSELHIEMEEALEWIGAGSTSGRLDGPLSPPTWIEEARSALTRIREADSSSSPSGPLVESIHHLEAAVSSSDEEHDRYEYLAEVTIRLRSVVDAAVAGPQRLSS